MRYSGNKIIGWRLFLSLCFTIFLIGCGSEETDPEFDGDSEEVVRVPIRLSVDYGWTVGLGEEPTRSQVYDDDELTGVREAQIFTFRRPIGSDEDVPFIYDPTNSMVIPLSPDHTSQLGGEATLNKRPGFEYRIFAVSYSMERTTGYKEILHYISTDLLFRTYNSDLQRLYIPVEPDMSLDEFKVKLSITDVKYEAGCWTDFLDGRQGYIYLTGPGEENKVHMKALSGQVADYPRLFFCDCYIEHDGARSEIIPYSIAANTEDKSEGLEKTDLEVKGELRVGMAKVVININSFTSHHFIYNGEREIPVKWLVLMVDNTPECLNVSDLRGEASDVEVSLSDRYTPVCYGLLDGASSMTLTAYLPPVRTHLAVRADCEVSYKDMEYYLNNYKICPEDNVTVDPLTAEETRNTYNEVFYLRPNHKYVINVDNSEDLLKYPINPDLNPDL